MAEALFSLTPSISGTVPLFEGREVAITSPAIVMRDRMVKPSDLGSVQPDCFWGVAGTMTAALDETVQAGMGVMHELDAIAGAVIGGGLLAGGKTLAR